MSDKGTTVVFMGSPDFAVPSLEALHASGRFAPSLVVSQPDRPRGRGREVSPTPVRATALSLGLPTAVMSKENYADVVRDIATLDPDVVIVVAFGIILRKDLLDMPRLGCVNVHASLLPKYRGVSPIQAALLAGDEVTGCTTMMIDEGIDTGDILLAEETPIESSDNAGSLTDRLARVGAHLLVRTLDGLVDGSVKPTPQSGDAGSYTKKIRKSHGRIDWSAPAQQVARRIRAMTPWPSAYTFLDGRRIIFTEVETHDGSGEPGTVLSIDPLCVACGEGAVAVRRLKPEGARSMTPSEFLAGHALSPGYRFTDTV